MDKLERYIKENKEAFDIHTPDSKIWDKIADQKNSKSKVIRFPRPLKYAASFLLVAISVFLIYQWQSQPTTDQVQEWPNELLEIDQYYEGQVEAQLAQLKSQVNDQEILDLIANDLEELNSEKEELFGSYAKDLDNEQVLEALLSTYRMKIQVLEDILLTIQENEVNNEKSL